MNQSRPESHISDDTCEAVNCSARGTTTILVKTGDRSIALNLCDSCISEFEDAAVGRT